jgi:hypothetical protein
LRLSHLTVDERCDLLLLSREAMGQISSIPLSASLSLLAGVLCIAWNYVFRTSKLSIVPGPASSHFFYGHMREIWGNESSDLLVRWFEVYGPVVKYYGLLNVRLHFFFLLIPFRRRPDVVDISQSPRLATTDMRALQYVLQHGDIYQKPGYMRRSLAQVFGRGVLVTEGERHRVQRKALNPAFGLGQLRDLTGVFLDKANEVCSLLNSLVLLGELLPSSEMSSLLSCPHLRPTLLISRRLPIFLAAHSTSSALLASATPSTRYLSRTTSFLMHSRPCSTLRRALR